MSPTTSPFRMTFSSAQEALLLLRWQMKASGKPRKRGPQVISWEDFYNKIEKITPQGAATKQWQEFTSGDLKAADQSLHCQVLAETFIAAWPAVLKDGASTDAGRIAAYLEDLPPLRAETFPTLYTKATQSIVIAYINGSMTDQGLLGKLSEKLKEDGLCEAAEELKQKETILPKNILSHIRATDKDKQRLQQDGVPYTLFLRGFARLLYDDRVEAENRAGKDVQKDIRKADTRVELILEQLFQLEDPKEQKKRIEAHASKTQEDQKESTIATITRLLQQLPIWPTQEPVTYGAYLHWSLNAEQGLLNDAVAELKEYQEKSRSDIQRKFDGARFIVDDIEELSSSSFQIKVEFSIKYHVPKSSDYGYMLFVLVDFARQLGLSWRTSQYNIRRVRSGLPPITISFGIHAGPKRFIQLARRVGAIEGGICLTSEAHYHARATDLRVVWGNQQTVPASDDGPSLPCYPIASIPSYLYFSLPIFLDKASATRLKAYSDLYQAHPIDTSLGLELAMDLYHKGHFEQATGTIHTVLAVAPDLAVAHDLLAYVHINRCKPQEEWTVSHWKERAGHYRQAIAAARNALTSDPKGLEDFFVTSGIVLMHRALHLLSSKELECILKGWSNCDKELPHELRGMGFEGAYNPWSNDTGIHPIYLIRSAALTDLHNARDFFHQGLVVSLTKSRSIFWCALVNTAIESASGTGTSTDTPQREVLQRVFREVGFLTANSSLDELIEVVTQAIKAYKATVNLEIYVPQIRLAFAVVWWDFVGPSFDLEDGQKGSLEDIKNKTLLHIEDALAKARQLTGTRVSVIGPWLDMWEKKSFIETCNDIKSIVEDCNDASGYENIFSKYLQVSM